MPRAVLFRGVSGTGKQQRAREGSLIGGRRFGSLSRQKSRSNGGEAILVVREELAEMPAKLGR
jgi:hypothetical protein